MRKDYLKGFAVFVISVVFLFGLCNFLNQAYRADKKEFWLDEKFSLKNTVQGKSYLKLFSKGAVASEANAAPLDYLFTKILDDAKEVVSSFGVSDEVYYRLWANFVMVFSGFVVVCFFARDILRSSFSDSIRMFQLFLLMLLPFTYLFRPLTYHYAAEVRPYALWFALWFISIGVCSLARTSKVVLSLCLSLLAMTMVGSVFQILAIGISYLAVRWLQSGGKKAIGESLQVFTVPFFLVVFYAYPAAYGNRSLEPWAAAWHRFFELWSHESSIIPMLLIVIGSLYLTKRTQSMMIGPLSVLIVFLIGPAIFLITIWRGYFFTERQYIYYDVHRAVFLLSLINALPFYLEKIKDQKKLIFAMVVIFALCGSFIFSKKTLSHIREVIHNVGVVLAGWHSCPM